MQKLIDEIKACRDEQYGFAALALALIIPNVCANFCKKGRSKSADYIAWCNDWVEYPENLDGEVIYSLRCAFLHAMDGNLATTKLKESNRVKIASSLIAFSSHTKMQKIL